MTNHCCRKYAPLYCWQFQRIDYDYQVGQKVLIWNDGMLHNAESWAITSVHTNGTSSVQCRNKSERMNIRRVKPFDEKQLKRVET
jgi:hypothetical protein